MASKIPNLEMEFCKFPYHSNYIIKYNSLIRFYGAVEKTRTSTGCPTSTSS